MTDLLDDWQPEVRAAEADAVLSFITRYLEIHRKPPRLQECWSFRRNAGTKLNETRVRRAIVRLRRQNLVSQTALRPMQKAVQARYAKQTGGADATD